MSSIKFNCPDCDKAYKVPEQYAGKKVKCKKCGSTMRVPGEKSGKSKSRSSSGDEKKSKRRKSASSKASKRSSTGETETDSETEKPSKAKAAARPATARIKRGKPTTGTQAIDVADITAELKRYERKREGDNEMARGTGRMVLFKGTKPKKSFRLSGDPVTIGRGEDCDITLPMDSVSSEHIKMEVRLGKFTATDLKSVNGLIVNGRPVRRASLSDGDIIQLGEAILRIDCG